MNIFHRQLNPLTSPRPLCIDKSSDEICLASPGDINWNLGKTDVQLNTSLYLKNESYSLLQIFNNDKTQAEYYIHGSIGSVYFSANKYHWYHAPVSGKIISLKRIPGIIYAIDEENVNAYDDLPTTENSTLDNWIKYGGSGLILPQLYLGHVATRCIIEIEVNK